MNWFRTNVRRAAVLLGALLPAAACALNLQFLSQAPIAFADAEDEAIFNQHLDALLESGELGQKTTWENPNTGAKGELTLLERFDYESRPCGNVDIRNEAGGRTGGGVLTSCRLGTGEWKWVVLPGN